MTTIKDQRIEGPWALALKVHISIVTLLIPPILTWCVWITGEQFKDREFRNSGERFTQTDGRKLEDKITNQLAPKIERVDLRVQSLERNFERVFTKLDTIEEAIKGR